MIPINILNGEASDMMALNDFRDFFHFHGGCQLAGTPKPRASFEVARLVGGAWLSQGTTSLFLGYCSFRKTEKLISCF
jgi:hypothetical protein